MVDHRDETRFERTDVRVGPVVGFLGVLGALIVGVMGLLWATQSRMLDRVQALNARSHPFSTEFRDQLPPRPRIEGIGPRDTIYSVNDPNLPDSAAMQRMREDAALRDGWTDAAGRKHPPLKDAIKLALSKWGKP